MRAHGFSLLEGLIALTIMATLAATGGPAFSRLLAEQQATAAINQLAGTIHQARYLAVVHRHPTVLCPANKLRCAARHQWHLGAILFADHNADGARQPSEPLLAKFAPLPTGDRVFWRSFRNRSYLRFQPDGMTDWQNGTFTYCPANGDLSLARALIVNTAGRIAMSRDANGDRLHEDARGNPLRCG